LTNPSLSTTIAAMTTPAAASTTNVPVREGHPKGLWVLFITEMWERFSYYGMRALLVLYLIQSTGTVLTDGKENWNPGFGWSKAAAADLSAWYTAAVYVTPLVGGWLADRFLGTHRSMLIGGVIIALGHITLAFTEFFGITAGEAVTFKTGPGALICFMAGLALIIVGTGFFKPCVSVMVGQLYERNDPRKDSGFTIFYMGINLGAFFSPLVAGYLGERIGWHWGFGSAAVGMILGLIFYCIYRPRYLHNIGLQPARRATDATAVESHPAQRMTAVDWQRLIVIVVLALLGNIFFWAAFEQASTSLNFFAVEKTDRTLGGMWTSDDGFPASWYQSVNPFVILIFGPVFAWLWVWLERRNRDPSTPMKFVWGLYLLGLAFLAMVAGALKAQGGDRVGPQWLLLTYLGATWGELCLSPVGLSMVTRLAPPHLQSLMMGLWFLSMAASNFVAGKLAVVSTHLDTSQHTIAFAPGETTASIWYEAKPQELRLLVDGNAAAFGDHISFKGQSSFKGQQQTADLEFTSSSARGDKPAVPGLFVADTSHLPVRLTDIEELSGTLTTSGETAKLTSELKHDHYTFILPGLPGFYLALVLFPIGAGVVLMLLTPILKRMMHGVH
jgi:proton-dependent oligopeptide transporter, POT family